MDRRILAFFRATPRRGVAYLAVMLLVAASRVSAMSVLPPTFPELVAESSTIVHARVTDVTSRAVTSPNGQKVVKTFVTFTVLKTLKGAANGTLTLSFLGGTDPATGERWMVPGMPSFQPGREEIVFATAGESACPLVAAGHGRYRVETDADTGRHYVTRDNHAPLTSVADIVQPMESSLPAATASASVTGALAPEDFENRIAAEVAHPTPPSSPP